MCPSTVIVIKLIRTLDKLTNIPIFPSPQVHHQVF